MNLSEITYKEVVQEWRSLPIPLGETVLLAALGATLLSVGIGKVTEGHNFSIPITSPIIDWIVIPDSENPRIIHKGPILWTITHWKYLDKQETVIKLTL